MKSFNEYLHEYFSESNPDILDDDLVDCTADWLANIGIDELIDLADKWGKEVAVEAGEAFMRQFKKELESK